MDDKTRPQWPYLAGSQTELRQVADSWQPSAGPSSDPSILTGTAASVAALGEAMPGSRYIHLATHGFFADEKFRSAFQHDPARDRLAMGGFELMGRRGTATGRNPMVLSGVVLAGANLLQKTNEWGAPVGDDGILTAEEVASLDLRAADLVVLSACDTGLGEKAGGEGVFGLQRAFGLAGARTVVASLWKVDDEATRQLMTEFYRNLWEKKLPKLESLRQAQLSMLHGTVPSSTNRGLGAERERPSADGDHSARIHPRLWAAWVLSGDPGDLSAMQSLRDSAYSSPELPLDPANPASRLVWTYIVTAILVIIFLAGAGWIMRDRLVGKKS